jgi:hypothetical protein
MANISLCSNMQCLLRDNCKRATLEPGPYQSYHHYDFAKNDNYPVRDPKTFKRVYLKKGECIHQIKVNNG